MNQFVNKKLNKDGLLEFGMFPQTHISDKNLIEELNKITKKTRLGFTKYQNELYYQFEAKPYEYVDHHLDSYSDGETVYNQVEWFKVEPIKWRIIKNENGICTLLSEYLLTARMMDDDSNSYMNSLIRQWLIKDFYKMAFNDFEKAELIGNNNSFYDRIWLLSKNEITENEAIDSREERAATVTDFCLACSALLNPINKCSSWWLRSAYKDDDEDRQLYVYSGGYIDDTLTDYDYLCVRPTIMIHINEDEK